MCILYLIKRCRREGKIMANWQLPRKMSAISIFFIAPIWLSISAYKWTKHKIWWKLIYLFTIFSGKYIVMVLSWNNCRHIEIFAWLTCFSEYVPYGGHTCQIWCLHENANDCSLICPAMIKAVSKDIVSDHTRQK